MRQNRLSRCDVPKESERHLPTLRHHNCGGVQRRPPLGLSTIESRNPDKRDNIFWPSRARGELPRISGLEISLQTPGPVGPSPIKGFAPIACGYEDPKSAPIGERGTEKPVKPRT